MKLTQASVWTFRAVTWPEKREETFFATVPRGLDTRGTARTEWFSHVSKGTRVFPILSGNSPAMFGLLVAYSHSTCRKCGLVLPCIRPVVVK